MNLCLGSTDDVPVSLRWYTRLGHYLVHSSRSFHTWKQHYSKYFLLYIWAVTLIGVVVVHQNEPSQHAPFRTNRLHWNIIVGSAALGKLPLARELADRQHLESLNPGKVATPTSKLNQAGSTHNLPNLETLRDRIHLFIAKECDDTVDAFKTVLKSPSKPSSAVGAAFLTCHILRFGSAKILVDLKP